MRFVIWGLMLVASLLLQSCIEGEEEIWLEKDGSGRVEALYRVPTVLLSEQDGEDLKASLAVAVAAKPDLQLLTNRISRAESGWLIHIVIRAENVTKLEGVRADRGGEQLSKGRKILYALLGGIDVDKKGLRAELQRTVNLAPLIHEYAGARAGVVLNHAEFRYTVHLPVAADSSNAHEAADGGKTLHWEYRLGELRGQPIEMKVKAVVPIPFWVHGLLAGFLLLACCGLWGLLRGRGPWSRPKT